MSAAFTPWIIAHTGAALAALLLGAAVFFRRKGTHAHRHLGRLWAGLMLVVIGSSFFIRTDDEFSWLHLLSVGSLGALLLGIHWARRRQPQAHRSTMLGLYLGGLVIAGFFTLMPSRLLGGLFWQLLG